MDSSTALHEALRGISKVEAFNTNLHHGVEAEAVLIHGHDGFRNRAEGSSFTHSTFLDGGQVVQTNDHVLGRNGHRSAIRRFQDVVRSEHQDASFGLSFHRERKVHSHLVTIEVSVERSTDQGVKLNSFTFHQLWLKRLNSETVKRWCAVEQHRALANDFFENIPHLGTGAFHHALRVLDVAGVTQVHQTLNHEGLEQFQSHDLGQTTLVELELRTDHDDRTARVVHALTQKVLAETTLLTLEHVGEALERTVSRSRNRTSTTAVIKERIHSFLEHPLFVVDNDLWCTEIQQTAQTVVSVDHATVKVVQVRGRKAPTIQLNHGPELWRNYRDNLQHHRCR